MTSAQGLTFGEIADEFDRIRPGYPDQLASDVLSYVGAPAVDALEVGAGTGKATAAFTKHGVAVTAVEPDAAMAELLAKRQPGVRIIPTSFENFHPDTEFGLLYCAQAWHWTDPARRWPLAAAALAPGGAIALFWNSDRLVNPDARQILRDAIARHAPQLMFVFDDEPGDEDLLNSWPGTDLVRRDEFTDLDTRAYLWERVLTAEEYLAYLGTRSACRMLPAAVREELFTEIAERLTGSVTLAVETALYLARRR